MQYKLVSFPICPFVQRAVIMFRCKQQDVDIEYIDIESPPQWYLDRVPTGKVPSLWVNDDVLFESAAINEFINETASGDNMLPADPVQRARARAWVAFADQLLMNQFRMFVSGEQSAFESERDTLLADTLKLDKEIKGPYFFGDQLTLTDIAFAPIFTRMKLAAPVYAALKEKAGQDSALIQWIETLVSLDEVKHSVMPDFEERFLVFFRKRGSFVLAG